MIGVMDLIGSVLIPAAVGGLSGVVINALVEYLRDKASTDKRFRAAALLVRDELHANIVRLKIAVESSEIPDGLESQTYQDVQMLLAQGLRRDALDKVRKAYIHIRTPRAFEERWTTLVHREPAGTQPVEENVKAALADAEAAHAALARFVPKEAGDFSPD